MQHMLFVPIPMYSSHQHSPSGDENTYYDPMFAVKVNTPRI